MKTKNEYRFEVPADIAAGVLISGCSTVGEGLVGEQRENILPFAEQTVSSLSAQRIDFRDSEFVYLRAISKPGASEVEALRTLLAQADRLYDLLPCGIMSLHIGEGSRSCQISLVGKPLLNKRSI